MKNKSLITLALWLVLQCSVLWAADIKVIAVSGPAGIILPGETQPQSVKPGTQVPFGSRIYTAAGGKVILTPFAGITSMIGENTDITISKPENLNAVYVAANAGTILSDIDRSKSGAVNYTVITPKGVASARGTNFVTQIAANGDTLVSTNKGSVGIEMGGVQVTVTPGRIFAEGRVVNHISELSAASRAVFDEAINTATDLLVQAVESGSVSAGTLRDVAATLKSQGASVSEALGAKIRQLTGYEMKDKMSRRERRETPEGTDFEKLDRLKRLLGKNASDETLTKLDRLNEIRREQLESRGTFLTLEERERLLTLLKQQLRDIQAREGLSVDMVSRLESYSQDIQYWFAALQRSESVALVLYEPYAVLPERMIRDYKSRLDSYSSDNFKFILEAANHDPFNLWDYPDDFNDYEISKIRQNMEGLSAENRATLFRASEFGQIYGSFTLEKALEAMNAYSAEDREILLKTNVLTFNKVDAYATSPYSGTSGVTQELNYGVVFDRNYLDAVLSFYKSLTPAQQEAVVALDLMDDFRFNQYNSQSIVENLNFYNSLSTEDQRFVRDMDIDYVFRWTATESLKNGIQWLKSLDAATLEALNYLDKESVYWLYGNDEQRSQVMTIVEQFKQESKETQEIIGRLELGDSYIRERLYGTSYENSVQELIAWYKQLNEPQKLTLWNMFGGYWAEDNNVINMDLEVLTREMAFFNTLNPEEQFAYTFLDLRTWIDVSGEQKKVLIGSWTSLSETERHAFSDLTVNSATQPYTVFSSGRSLDSVKAILNHYANYNPNQKKAVLDLLIGGKLWSYSASEFDAAVNRYLSYSDAVQAKIVLYARGSMTSYSSQFLDPWALLGFALNNDQMNALLNLQYATIQSFFNYNLTAQEVQQLVAQTESVIATLVPLTAQWRSNGNEELLNVLYNYNANHQINQALIDSGKFANSLLTDVTISTSNLDTGRIYNKAKILSNAYNKSLVKVVADYSQNETTKTIGQNILNWLNTNDSADGLSFLLNHETLNNADTILGTHSAFRLSSADASNPLLQTNADNYSAFIGKNITLSTSSLDLSSQFTAAGGSQVFAVTAIRDLSIQNDLTITANNVAERNQAIVLGAGRSLTVADGKTIESTAKGMNLAMGAQEDITYTNVNIHADGNVLVGTLKNLSITGGSFNTGNRDKLYLFANDTLSVNGTSFANMRTIHMEATTIDLRNLNFPGGSSVALHSRDGGIDGKYPTFGSAGRQVGRVNFIENIQYNSNPITDKATFDTHGQNIHIGQY